MPPVGGYPGQHPASFEPPQARGGIGKWIGLGCGLSCAALLLIVVVAGGAVLYSSWGAIQAVMEMGKLVEKHENAQDALDKLDRKKARIAKDATKAELTAADIDAFLDVHEQLAADVELMAAARRRVAGSWVEQEQGDLGDLSELFGEFWEAEADCIRSHADALDTARRVLEKHGLTPTDVRRLAAIIDWHFLERPGVEHLLLEREDKLELHEAYYAIDESSADLAEEFDWRYLGYPYAGEAVLTREELGTAWESLLRDADSMIAEETEDDAWRSELEASRDTLARWRSTLTTSAGLSVATRTVLESRRTELEAISQHQAEAFAVLLESETACSGFELF